MKREVLEIHPPSMLVTEHDLLEPRRLVAVEPILAQQFEQLHELFVLEALDTHGVACAWV